MLHVTHVWTDLIMSHNTVLSHAFIFRCGSKAKSERKDYCCGCIPLYDGIILQGFFSLIMCVLGTTLAASANNEINPLNHIFDVVVKQNESIIRENINIINILLIVSGVTYGVSCCLLMIGASLKKPWVYVLDFSPTLTL